MSWSQQELREVRKGEILSLIGDVLGILAEASEAPSGPIWFFDFFVCLCPSAVRNIVPT